MVSGGQGIRISISINGKIVVFLCVLHTLIYCVRCIHSQLENRLVWYHLLRQRFTKCLHINYFMLLQKTTLTKRLFRRVYLAVLTEKTGIHSADHDLEIASAELRGR